MVDLVHKAPEDNPDHLEIMATQEKKVKITSNITCTTVIIQYAWLLWQHYEYNKIGYTMYI